MASDADAPYDDEVSIDGDAIEPMSHGGSTPASRSGCPKRLPTVGSFAPEAQAGAAEALEFMGFTSGHAIGGTRIDVAFVGSCTNGRLSDLREAAQIVKGHRTPPHVTALVVPGSQAVSLAAEREGLDQIFRDGWIPVASGRVLDVPRDESGQARRSADVAASSSNRNFKGPREVPPAARC